MICNKYLKVEKCSRETIAMKLADFEKKLKNEILINLVSIGWNEDEAKDVIDTKDLGIYAIDIIDASKDFSVNFNWGNIFAGESYMNIDSKDGNLSEILGFHEENGFCWLGINAGGNWEKPLFFIIYYDGKTFRGYVPLLGNVFNSMNMKALGNNDGDDSYKAEGSVKLMKEDFLTTMAISGISIIDLSKFSKIGSISKKILLDSEDLEEMLSAITNLSDDEIINEVIKDFADKNDLKIE